MSLRALSNKIKAHTPSAVWKFIRCGWYGLIDLVEKVEPYVRTREYCGITFYYNRGSSIMSRLTKEPVFEEEMCRSIEQDLQKGGVDPVFLDVGANLGLISAYVISKIPTVKIFAFEPGPAQRELLKMTVAKNGLSEKITVYADGLGKEPGKAVFHTHDPKFVAGDGFIDTGRARAAHAIEVNVTTLDVWWESQNRPEVAVVKIDTEGAELWILQGAMKMLEKARPVLYLEIEPKNLKVYPYNHLDIFAFLEQNQYQLFTLEGVRVTNENFDTHIGIEDTYIARHQ